MSNQIMASDAQKSKLASAFVKVAKAVNADPAADLTEIVIKVAADDEMFRTSGHWTQELVAGVNRIMAVATVTGSDKIKRAHEYATVDPSVVEARVTGIAGLDSAASELFASHAPAVKAASVKHPAKSWEDLYPAIKVAGDCDPSTTNVKQKPMKRFGIPVDSLSKAKITTMKQEVKKAFDLLDITCLEPFMLTLKWAANAFNANGITLSDMEEAAYDAYDAESVKVAFDALAEAIVEDLDDKHIERFDIKTAANHLEDYSGRWNVEPYISVDKFINTMKAAAVRFKLLEDLDAELKMAADTVAARPAPGAGVGGVAGSVINSTFKLFQPTGLETKGSDARTSEQLGISTLSDLFTPDTFMALQKMKAQEALVDALHDETIKKFNLDKVSTAYNNIASIAPKAMLSAEALTPLLRDQLESNSSTFSTQQKVDLNKSL